jgi:hypothetical protein
LAVALYMVWVHTTRCHEVVVKQREIKKEPRGAILQEIV